MIGALRTARGVLRSLRIYHGDRARNAAMDALYRNFIQPGDLAFDIGAHVGDRTASFRRLGARVVAVEPQPALARALKLMFALDRNVRVEQVAIARKGRDLQLMINVDNPTVSTASGDFVRAAADASGWREQRWSRSIKVSAVTLDALIAWHGTPAFIKIDIEGFEAEALAGLLRAPPALSFEFTTIQRDVALAALARCEALHYARFNAALGESQALVHPEWIDATQISRWLQNLPHEANSGDIYARLA